MKGNPFFSSIKLARIVLPKSIPIASDDTVGK
jgi:hypothetical protein